MHLTTKQCSAEQCIGWGSPWDFYSGRGLVFPPIPQQDLSCTITAMDCSELLCFALHCTALYWTKLNFGALHFVSNGFGGDLKSYLHNLSLISARYEKETSEDQILKVLVRFSNIMIIRLGFPNRGKGVPKVETDKKKNLFFCKGFPYAI